MPERRAKSVSLGADLAVNPREGTLAEEVRGAHAGARRGCGAGCRADSLGADRRA